MHCPQRITREVCPRGHCLPTLWGASMSHSIWTKQRKKHGPRRGMRPGSMASLHSQVACAYQCCTDILAPCPPFALPTSLPSALPFPPPFRPSVLIEPLGISLYCFVLSGVLYEKRKKLWFISTSSIARKHLYGIRACPYSP